MSELTPPRIEEGFWAAPTKREDTFGDTIERMSSKAFGDAWQKLSTAGTLKVEADDPRIFTAYKQANKYIADMASAGVSTLEGIGGAVAGAIGEAFGGSPEGEVRLARDILGMTEAFAGSGIARGANLMDDLIESGAGAAGKVAARATQPGPMPEVLGSNLGNVGVKTPYKPSLFRSASESGPLSSNYSVAEFYSPTVETLRNTSFPSKGMTGGDLLKLLQDKTPGIRKAELDALNLGIDKSKRYNREEILDLAQKRSYKVTAEVEDRNQYQSTQRQSLNDEEVGYDEIKINAKPVSDDVPSFLPSRGYTHYDPETIAHTRMSIRRSSKDGTEYALVEEIQSDLIQKKALEPRGPVSLDEAYDEVLGFFAKDITESSPEYKRIYEGAKDWFDDWFKISSEQSRQSILRDKGLEVSPEDTAKLEKLIEVAKSRPSAEQLAEGLKVKPAVAQRLADTFEKAGWEEGSRIERRTKAVGASPISEDSDAVRMSLQAAMAKASDAEVSSLIIPNIQRIAAERAKPDSEEFANYIKPSSGFSRTYQAGVDKFVKQLQAEYGDAVKIEVIELPYRTREQLPKSALKIDFGELRKRGDVDLRVSRFAEGGMVQMQKLFQEGGMADDGMNREPQTGNEVPPGSLASEVRDDIPAKLSEGEYVVPADVVRFFGVKFFEDLRNQAKEGLTEMDADGRIGGTPAAPEEELSPEEEQMLREALGGMNMAEGGVVPAPFDRTQFKVDPAAGGFQSVRYINPKTKEERVFQFLNGMPLGVIPEGFVQATAEAAKVEEVKPSAGAPSVEGVGGEGKDMADAAASKDAKSGYAEWAETNRDAIMNDPLGFGTSAIAGATSKGSDFLGGILGAVSPALGVIGDLGKMSGPLSDAKAALSVAESKGLKGTPEYDKLDKDVKDLTSSLSSPVSKAGVLGGIFATGKDKLAALTEPTKGGTYEYDYTKDISAATRSVTQGGKAPPSRPSSLGAPSQSATTSSMGSAAASSSGRGGSTPSSGDDRSASGYGVDARAKGGLMLKSKKNKASGKGLANK